MRTRARFRWLAAIAFTGLASAAAAGQQSKPPSNLYDLSLEDLMQIDVVTASRLEEKLTRSTSVMSVITARDIERAGFRTVYDVLARRTIYGPTFESAVDLPWDELVGELGEACSAYLLR